MKYASPISGIDYVSYFSFIYAFFRGGMRIKIASIAQSADGLLPNAEPPAGVWMTKPYSTSNVFVKMFNALNPLMTTIVTRTKKMNNIIGKIGCNGLYINNTTTDMHPLFANSSSSLVVSNEIEGMTEVEVPYYNSTHITPCVDNGATASMFPVIAQSEAEGSYPLPVLVFGSLPYNTNFFLQQNDAVSPVLSTMQSSTQTTFHIYRQAADDFSFHYIMGIPTMISETSTNINTFIPAVP
jgi:hypothetical protein